MKDIYKDYFNFFFSVIGADAFYYPKVVCHVYFSKSKDECGGGMLALDGQTGNEIWRHYSAHEIFAVNCNVDLNADNIKDCLGGGRMAVSSFYKNL